MKLTVRTAQPRPEVINRVVTIIIILMCWRFMPDYALPLGLGGCLVLLVQRSKAEQVSR